MIKCVFNLSTKELSISGHAGSGEFGRDLICAAVSMLSYTLEYHLGKSGYTVERDEDKALFRAVCPQGYYNAFEIICDGLRLLSKSYADYVSYEEVM